MTIFVGGIHAAGKTFLLGPTCEKLGVKHATASQLIKEQRGLASWDISKKVNDVDENQMALISAVRRLTGAGEALVLDGHFVLRRSTCIHVEIGVDVFSQLMLQGVILIETPAQLVADRLLGRGDTTWSLEEIECFAQSELSSAISVCKYLSIPFVRLYSPTQDVIENAIVEFMN